MCGDRRHGYRLAAKVVFLAAAKILGRKSFPLLWPTLLERPTTVHLRLRNNNSWDNTVPMDTLSTNFLLRAH